MSIIESELNEEENKEDFDISKENKKLYEKLMKDLGFLSDKEEKPKSKPIDMQKAFRTFSKFQENDSNHKDFFLDKKLNKSLLNRINELQQELNNVSKEINDYVELYSDNTLLKKETNFNQISEELKLYSSKLDNIINSDFYKNSLTPKPIISPDKKILKNQIETNLKNYTNTTSRLIELVAQEKEFCIYQKNYDTTTHQMYINKYFYENNDANKNFETNLIEIEKELMILETIVGTKKLDMGENTNISQTLNKLLKIIKKSDFQLFKDKTLQKINEILDEVLDEKEISSEISEHFIKLKELYAIYEVYENYDEIMKYIKTRLLAILDMHEKSTNFNTDLDFLKKIIEENEKQFNILGKKYSETFEELAGLENILKELRNLDKYITQLLV